MRHRPYNHMWGGAADSDIGRPPDTGTLPSFHRIRCDWAFGVDQSESGRNSVALPHWLSPGPQWVSSGAFWGIQTSLMSTVKGELDMINQWLAALKRLERTIREGAGEIVVSFWEI